MHKFFASLMWNSILGQENFISHKYVKTSKFLSTISKHYNRISILVRDQKKFILPKIKWAPYKNTIVTIDSDKLLVSSTYCDMKLQEKHVASQAVLSYWAFLLAHSRIVLSAVMKYEAIDAVKSRKKKKKRQKKQ